MTSGLQILEDIATEDLAMAIYSVAILGVFYDDDDDDHYHHHNLAGILSQD